MESLQRVMDALDMETYIVCQSQAEGRQLAKRLMQKLNFKLYDIVYIKHAGPGARVRLRAYIHQPGDEYHWLKERNEDGC